MRSYWKFFEERTAALGISVSWLCGQVIRRWAYAVRNDPVDKGPARLFLLSKMWRSRLHIHSQRTQPHGLGRGPFPGVGNCPTGPQLSFSIIQPFRAWKQMLQIAWPRLSPAFEWDNKMGFVHPFKMGPNYVWLINETLCPNRGDCRAVVRKHFV